MNKTIFTAKYVILLLGIWQFFSVLLMAIGVWPYEIAYLNLGLLVIFMLVFDSFSSLLLLMVSLPFYVAVPNTRFETLSLWRIVAAVLFGMWLLRGLWEKRSVKSMLGFSPWDKPLAVFVLLSLASLVYAKFQVEGLKLILFWINIYLVYLVASDVLSSRTRLITAVKALAASLGIVLVLGYAQLVVTFFTSFDVFWVYWASFVSELYYGPSLASVLMYSNSWFSYTGGTELRMFSIMPDSHSFSLLMVFAVAVFSSLLPAVTARQRKLLWAGIILAALAIVFSGTRAVWVGVLAPLAVVLVAFAGNFNRPIMKRALVPILCILVLFAASPLVDMGIKWLRTAKSGGNVLERVQSIYNLNEASNAGRIEMWKESLFYVFRHPLGTGAGNFIVISENAEQAQGFEDIAKRRNELYNLPEEYVTAHSLYLQTLAELGIAGLAGLAWFLWKYFGSVWKFLKQYLNQGSWAGVLVLNISLAMLWIFASAVFDVTLYNDKVLICFFILAAMSGVVLRRYPELKD